MMDSLFGIVNPYYLEDMFHVFFSKMGASTHQRLPFRSVGGEEPFSTFSEVGEAGSVFWRWGWVTLLLSQYSLVNNHRLDV